MTEDTTDEVRLTEEQRKEGYRTERDGSYVLVWHDKTQIALLADSPDVDSRAQAIVERRRKELKEVEEKTGWRPERSEQSRRS